MANLAKRPKNENQLAHLIAQTAIGEVEDTLKLEPGKNPAAVAQTG